MDEGQRGDRMDREPQARGARRPELQTVKLSVRYARYVLTSVATVAFGFAVN